jgi:adenine-specific DNA-methyltransferase
MATGIPRKKHQRDKSETGKSDNGKIELNYFGKKTRDVILSRKPPAFTARWGDESSDSLKGFYFWGDNLDSLAHLRCEKHPSSGKIKLIYIDPPYATKGIFQSRSLVDAYDDILTGPAYLEYLRERLILLHDLLAEDGSIFVHLDQNMAFHAKILMDEIFGSSNFQNWITRKKCNPKNYTKKNFGDISDYILFYSKSERYTWNRPVRPWADDHSSQQYPCVDKDGRRFKKVPVHAPGSRNGATGGLWKGKLPPPGKHWQYLPSTLDQMDARGEIYWSPTGNPRRMIYLDQSSGVPLQDIWLDYKDAHNQNIHVTGYPTEKNQSMMEMIIQAASNPGDFVLDCFAGSGTTLHAAHRLGRRWIGMDNGVEALKATIQRFKSGTSRMGAFNDDKKAKNLELAFGNEGINLLGEISVFAPREVSIPRDILPAK